jgi:hypothetical protein
MAGISLTTRKRLWANAGGYCSYPECEQRLLVPVDGDMGEVVVGEEAHIVAQRESGARSPKSLTDEERTQWQSLVDDRHGYQNLMLLCGLHHKVIDHDVANHPISRLVELKQAHEQEIDGRLSAERRNANLVEVRYAGIVDEWARRIEIDRWDGRISRVTVSGAMQESVLEDFRSLNDWLLRRVWPRTLPRLEDALLNFRGIAEDLDAVVTRFGTERGGDVLIDRVYKEVEGMRANAEQRRFLEQRSEYYQDLAADLAVELTRAVNLVCERVREQLWPVYRLEEGHATIGFGFNEALSFETFRPLYPPDAQAVPYSGLRKFVMERADRDFARGAGEPPQGAGLPGVN